jgi:hypothetical protein
MVGPEPTGLTHSLLGSDNLEAWSSKHIHQSDNRQITRTRYQHDHHHIITYYSHFCKKKLFKPYIAEEFILLRLLFKPFISLLILLLSSSPGSLCRRQGRHPLAEEIKMAAVVDLLVVAEMKIHTRVEEAKFEHQQWQPDRVDSSDV